MTKISVVTVCRDSEATLEHCVHSVAAQGVKKEHVLVDGNRVPKWRYPAEAVVKGDSRVKAIAAASILAKVVRDREMVVFDQQYPQYGFAGHKFNRGE